MINIPKEIFWFWQRGRRGWADCDVWSLDGYLISWLPEALRELAKIAHGCPPALYDDATGKEDQCWKWVAILEEMAEGFEAHREWEDDYSKAVGMTKDGKEYYDWKDPEWKAKFEAKQKEVEVKFERSKELMMKYWGNLWD